MAVCGEQLVWAQGGAGARDLFALDLGTGGVDQLTDHPADDAEPAFDPGCAHLDQHL